MKFNEIEKTPFKFVYAAKCTTCGNKLHPTVEEAYENKAFCDVCDLIKNLRFSNDPLTFESINLLEGNCPICKRTANVTIYHKRDGFLQCAYCNEVVPVWELDQKKYEKNVVILMKNAFDCVDQNNLDASLAYIEKGLEINKELINSNFKKTKRIFVAGEKVVRFSAFITPRIRLDQKVVIPILDLIAQKRYGSKLDEYLSDFSQLVHKKITIIAHSKDYISEYDLSILLQQIYLLLIIQETRDYDAFIHQIQFYLQSKVDQKNNDSYLRIIDFFFNTSNEKDNDWIADFWGSVVKIIEWVYPHSPAIKDVRTYYKGLIDPSAETSDRIDSLEENIQKYEQVLGISWNGENIREVKKQYRQLASIYHPDKGSSDPKQFLEIQEAYLFFKQIG